MPAYTAWASAALVDPVPWESKKDVLFWRGSTTGGTLRPDAWRALARFRLAAWAKAVQKEFPDSCFDAKDAPPASPSFAAGVAVDVGFHELTPGVDPDVAAQVTAEFPTKSFVGFSRSLAFKYLLVVDGNTWPARTLEYLQTNSVVLYHSIFVDWFTWLLQPFVHYVPVRADSADLTEKLTWLKDNDEAARRISENARALMRTIAPRQQMQCYFPCAARVEQPAQRQPAGRPVMRMRMRREVER